MVLHEVAMNTTLIRKPEARLTRPPTTLVPLIRQDVMDGRNAGLEHFRMAGEKLQEAKSQMRHGQWGDWLRKNFDFSQREADRWMQLAGRMEFSQVDDKPNSSRGTNFKTASEAWNNAKDPSHRPAWHEPVRQGIDRVNVEQHRQAELDKDKEKKLQHQLGLQLIDIGYKVLATKLHPDKGGSREAMTRLNRVRDILKGAI